MERSTPGTSYTDEIPLNEEHSMEQIVGMRNEKLIVVIDDSVTVRKIVETCLAREGYEVRGFADGVEAMRWLVLSHAEIPALIFLDIGLPKLNGYEVAQRLKGNSKLHAVVIVMISRRDGMTDKLKARLAGTRDYITKPFKTQDLLSVVRSHIPIPQAATRFVAYT